MMFRFSGFLAQANLRAFYEWQKESIIMFKLIDFADYDDFRE